MKQSSIEFSAGIFVLLGLVAIAWFAIQAGARIPLAGSTYAVSARFSNAGGLKPGSQVFLAGVPVGRVNQINLDPQFAAIVRLEVNKDVQLPSDTIASIKTSVADLRSATYRLRLHPHRRQANLNREWTRNKTTTAAPKFSGVKWMQIKAWQAQK